LEGFEPNPGPIGWGDIEKLVKSKVGTDLEKIAMEKLGELGVAIRRHFRLDERDPLLQEDVVKFFEETKSYGPFTGRWKFLGEEIQILISAPSSSIPQGKTSSMRTRFLRSRP
jgi:hypothetical protein